MCYGRETEKPVGEVFSGEGEERKRGGEAREVGCIKLRTSEKTIGNHIIVYLLIYMFTHTYVYMYPYMYNEVIPLGVIMFPYEPSTI